MLLDTDWSLIKSPEATQYPGLKAACDMLSGIMNLHVLVRVGPLKKFLSLSVPSRRGGRDNEQLYIILFSFICLYYSAIIAIIFV